MQSLANIQTKPLRWLWPHHFPLGKLTLLVGEQGAGKSFVALDLAARVSAGLPWPALPDQPNAAGGVLLLTEEHDLADITCPRLEAAGADLARIMNLPAVSADDSPPDDTSADDSAATATTEPFTLAHNLAPLEQAIANLPDCRLVIIDPLSAFLPQSGSRKRPDLSAIFSRLANLAARSGVAIVVVASFIASTSAAANHRAVATLAAQRGPACVWRISCDPQDPERRLLLPVKNNLAPRNPALAFTLQAAPHSLAANIAWEGTPREAPSPSPREKPNDKLCEKPRSPSGPAPVIDPAESQESQIARTVVWLTNLLAAHDGLLPTTQIDHAAEVAQIPPRMLKLARHKANLETKPTGVPGLDNWSLPLNPTP